MNESPEKMLGATSPGRPTLKKLEEAVISSEAISETKKREEIIKATSGKLGGNRELAELKKWEMLGRLAKRAPEFLSLVDESITRFHASFDREHTDSNEKWSAFTALDDIVTKIRGSVDIFLSDMGSKKFLELVEADLDAISSLCKKAYEIDKAFPNFELLDEENFRQAAISNLGKRGGEDMQIKERVGRFAIFGRKGEYYFMDQQANKFFKYPSKEVSDVKNGVVVLEFALPEFRWSFDDRAAHLFNGISEKLSGKYDSIRPAIADLYLGKNSQGGRVIIQVLDSQGNVLLDNVSGFAPNKAKTKALLHTGLNDNVLLSDGSLMFKGQWVQKHTYNAIYDWSNMGTDMLFETGGKFYRLDKDLELVTVGTDKEEVEKFVKPEAA